MHVQDPVSGYHYQRLIKYKIGHPVYNIPCSELQLNCSAVEMTIDYNCSLSKKSSLGDKFEPHCYKEWCRN